MELHLLISWFVTVYQGSPYNPHCTHLYIYIYEIVTHRSYSVIQPKWYRSQGLFINNVYYSLTMSTISSSSSPSTISNTISLPWRRPLPQSLSTTLSQSVSPRTTFFGATIPTSIPYFHSVLPQNSILTFRETPKIPREPTHTIFFPTHSIFHSLRHT